MGQSCSSPLFMLKAFFTAALCGLVLVGQLSAQEVIVARETKPKAPKQATPSSEQAPSEWPAPARTKPKSREKKSRSTTLTAEQMRMAGALAAERQENQSPPQQPAKTRGSDSEPAATESPIVSATPKPVKEETRTRETSASHQSSSRTPKAEPIGAVRPTMMESGRQEPSATPSGKPEARGEHTPAP
jgi:hypothetical protein